ncbi:MAG: stress response protein [Actinomycetota bacterium]
MNDQMQRARLIPTSGIGNEREAEQRATSALLAVITIVRDFSSALFDSMGASKARRAEVEAFTEVQLTLPDGQKVRPDGLVRITYGKSTWSALIEVKTGSAELKVDQLNNYLAAARNIDADVVLSISNEISVGGAHPTAGLNVRSNSKVQVRHLSWSKILTHAIHCKVHSGVEDPEQAWILNELIRYLEHPASGALAMSDMGPDWTEVRDGARESTLRRSSEQVAEVAAKWDELLSFCALRLRSETGADVEQVIPRAQRDPKARLAHTTAQLEEDGTLDGELRIPDTAGNIAITGDLRARQLTAAIGVQAPDDKRARGSITWLTRQIAETANPNLVIEAYPLRARTPAIATLGQALDDPTALVSEGSDIYRFVLTYRSEMGQARKTGGRRPGFIDSVTGLIDSLYGDVVQHIKPWTPSAPKVKQAEPAPDGIRLGGGDSEPVEIHEPRTGQSEPPKIIPWDRISRNSSTTT